MRYLVLFCLFFVFSLPSFSQDLIILNSGDEIEAKVTEIGDKHIKYKKYNNLSGPNYTIKKVKVLMIRYENGTKDIFGSNQEEANTNQENRTLSSLSFNINLLGLLQFGPILQCESRISSKAVIVPYVRYAFLGLATHLAWTGFSENSSLSPTTIGFGTGIKGFKNEYGDTFYYAGFLDLNFAKANYEINTPFETEEKSTSLATVSNFGYRWRQEDGDYINLGILLGADFTIKDEERYVDTGELYQAYEGVTPFAMIEFSFSL